MDGISVVWLKRDLRLVDHKPISAAIELGKPILLLYCEDPNLRFHPNYSFRHWRFVHECLAELIENGDRLRIGFRLDFLDPVESFRKLSQEYQIDTVFSYQETGVLETFAKDRALQDLFSNLDIKWLEYPKNGISRGSTNRKTWVKDWYAYS